MNHSKLVVHQHEDGLWYFWGEGTTSEYGPFPTKDDAIAGLQEYCVRTLGDD